MGSGTVRWAKISEETCIDKNSIEDLPSPASRKAPPYWGVGSVTYLDLVTTSELSSGPPLRLNYRTTLVKLLKNGLNR